MVFFMQCNYFGFGTNTVNTNTVNTSFKAFYFWKGKLKYDMNFIVYNWRIGMESIRWDCTMQGSQIKIKCANV